MRLASPSAAWRRLSRTFVTAALSRSARSFARRADWLLANGPINGESGDGLLLVLDVRVDADDPAATLFDGLLELVARAGDLGLRIALFDRRHHAAHGVDLVEFGEERFLQIKGEPFEEIAAAEGIDGFADARLMGQDLLGAKCQQRGLFGSARRRPRQVSWYGATVRRRGQPPWLEWLSGRG